MFKVGDKVLYVEHCRLPKYANEDGDTFNIGDTYLIVEVINDSRIWYRVEGTERGVWDYQIENKIRNTKLARKMYPNHKVVDKDWIYKNVNGTHENGGKND